MIKYFKRISLFLIISYSLLCLSKIVYDLNVLSILFSIIVSVTYTICKTIDENRQ